ncbi:MAG: hypothetical protein RR842_11990, partial [Gordonibacter sp.]|uniref:hypothetical protein n=1 Tax=Gordonibacter sp. TaxID=1968902 RepID=UPI002FC9DFD8
NGSQSFQELTIFAMTVSFRKGGEPWCLPRWFNNAKWARIGQNPGGSNCWQSVTFRERRIDNVTEEKNRANMSNKIWHIVRSAKQ